MTREEAIKQLEGLQRYCVHNKYSDENGSSIWGEDAQALILAIAALREQEEYEIQRHLKHFDIKEPRPEAVTKCHDLYDEDGGEILEQDSLEKKTSDSKTSDKKTSEWISVDERLPEESGRYLVLEKCFGYIVARLASWTHYYDGWEEDFMGRSLWYDYDSEYGEFEVRDITHWMPLPSAPEVEV